MLDRLLGQRITILMYHSVNPTPDKYSVSPEAFRRHVQIVRDNYAVVPLKHVLRGGHGNGRRRVVMTFDDAFVDFQEFASPTLSEFSVPATVFVPTGYIGRSNSWDRDNSDVSPKSVMTERQLRGLCQEAWLDWGSHTIDHVSMRNLAPAEMSRQAVRSRLALEDILGRSITMFSYPYGQRDDFSATTESALRESGYEIAVTTCWGTRNSARNAFQLRRIWLTGEEDDATVRAKIDGRYDWIGIKEYVGFAARRVTGSTIQRTQQGS